MFMCQLKYNLIKTFRVKELLIWMILFPVVLGCIYKLIIGNISAKNAFSAVPTAVVERTKDNMFHMLMDAFSNGENALISITYCDEEEARGLLWDGKVDGILVLEDAEGTEPAFTEEESVDIVAMMQDYLDTGVLPEMDGEARQFLEDFLEGSDQDYLSSFVSSYQGGSFIPNTKLSLWVRKSGPSQTTIKKMAEMYQSMLKSANEIVEKSLSGDENYGSKFSAAMETGEQLVTELPLTDGNTDPLASYMYNLIAMVAIFGSLTGMNIAFDTQANLSDVGARRSCSGMPKLPAILAGLFSCLIAQIFCIFVCITFIVVILGISFGSRLPLVYLGGIIAAAVGISMGFFFGALGKLGESAKSGIVMALNMSLLFLSGMMTPGIRQAIALNIPLLNELNPAAVICDAFYYLSMDEELTRFLLKLLVMSGYSAVFTLLGFMLTRRSKYASL